MGQIYGNNINEIRLNDRRNTLDSKVYFESNTEEEEPKETTIEEIDPSVAEANQKGDGGVERGENILPPAPALARHG